jgi:hypothetical protein
MDEDGKTFGGSRVEVESDSATGAGGRARTERARGRRSLIVCSDRRRETELLVKVARVNEGRITTVLQFG